jgi:2,3-bisphosphoglycerate-independent phosphoglycerate mutase
MIDNTTGTVDTEHSGNPVPFIAVSKLLLGRNQTLRSGILGDVAPTILSLVDIPMPTSMTGRNLLSDLANY